MGKYSFRRELLKAWSLPVGLYLVFPFAATLLRVDPGEIFKAGLYFVLVLAPIVIVGYLMAPWAGRSVPSSKVPAFALGGLGAILPLALPVVIGLKDGTLGQLSSIIAFWAFFALPASVIGSLLFIGDCERKCESELA
jgi:hypothetical protein